MIASRRCVGHYARSARASSRSEGSACSAVFRSLARSHRRCPPGTTATRAGKLGHQIARADGRPMTRSTRSRERWQEFPGRRLDRFQRPIHPALAVVRHPAALTVQHVAGDVQSPLLHRRRSRPVARSPHPRHHRSRCLSSGLISNGGGRCLRGSWGATATPALCASPSRSDGSDRDASPVRPRGIGGSTRTGSAGLGLGASGRCDALGWRRGRSRRFATVRRTGLASRSRPSLRDGEARWEGVVGRSRRFRLARNPVNIPGRSWVGNPRARRAPPSIARSGLN